MPHTVQSFVETLRSDGVEAGRQAAEKLVQEAQQQAAQIVRDAEAKARQIVEGAERERQAAAERTRTDLELASRDTVARLRDVLSQAINRLLSRASQEALSDGEFLKELIGQVASAYAQSDATGDQMMELNVSESMKHQLAEWAITSFRHEGGHEKLSVELHGALANAGFEYRVAGGTVEVTAESVVQVLSQIVTPQLQELIASSQQSEATHG